ncbi:hypothetical protein H5410_061726 [Solanum commersonii]|uniref:Uncharacterized protein n=1 Tax=Solanum commersonii TaxID=4109 RepID=A0A9J5WA24_SOLCO|nr:hypothetical protein H5410_061726 [Solanum commersonii]
MSETVQQIKEQVMNLTHRPTSSAPEDTDNDSDDEDDYILLNVILSGKQKLPVSALKNIAEEMTDRVVLSITFLNFSKIKFP